MTRTYIILSQNNHGEWTEGVEKVEASSARGAVRKLLNGENGTDGVFVAIPARSWQPMTVKTKTETRLTFS